MNNFWNERYSTKEYVYGEKPNQFLKEKLAKLKPGKVLFPGEGEGRNAVYAATLDWKTSAFDPSIEGKKKAEQLAKKNGVQIEYTINNYEDVNFPSEEFDCIVLTFAHMPPLKRKTNHQRLVRFLKPGGVLILEGFSKQQIHRNTGGPQNVEMLFSTEELQNDFDNFSNLTITETERILNEGVFHQGNASVIRVLGIK